MLQTKSGGAPVRRGVQARGEVGLDNVHQEAAAGVSGGGGALPFAGQIQHSFGGFDVSGIRAHTGQAAQAANERMGSMAYATGQNVAFRGAPDLFTAAHEAAHVIQQRAGVQLRGGVGETGDRYEQHADAVAARVVQGRSAEDLLSGFTGLAPVQRRSAGGGGGVQLRAVQHTGEDLVCSPEDGPMTYADAGPTTSGGTTSGSGGGTSGGGTSGGGASATYADQDNVGHTTVSGESGGRTLGVSTAGGGTIEAGREFPLGRLPSTPVPIAAVPGLFLTMSGGVKAAATAAISGLTNASTEREYGVSVTGTIQAGIEYGAPPAASLYLRGGPSIRASGRAKFDATGVKEVVADLSLDSTISVGVQAGDGAFDYSTVLARANIARVVGYQWKRGEGSRWGSVEPGSALVQACRDVKAAYDRAVALARAGAETVATAGQYVSRTWNWLWDR